MAEYTCHPNIPEVMTGESESKVILNHIASLKSAWGLHETLSQK